MVLRGSRILRAALLVAAVILLGALGREVLPSVFPPAGVSGPEAGLGVIHIGRGSRTTLCRIWVSASD